MNINELIAQYRREADDNAVPPFLGDAEIIGLYNEAIDEACLRKRLLFDDTSAFCSIAVTSGTSTYATDNSIVYVAKAYLVNASDEISYLDLHDRDGLDRRLPQWREEEAGEPTRLIVDEQSVTLIPEPAAAYTLKLEVYRVPTDSEKLGAGAGISVIITPKIAVAHHRHLYHWVLSQALIRPDADLFSPGKAEFHREQFDRYFGPTPDADRKRCTRENVPHVNTIW